MNEYIGNVRRDKGKPGQNYEYAILPSAETEVKDHLTEQTSMLEESHEDEPIRHEEMLAFLLITNIG